MATASHAASYPEPRSTSATSSCHDSGEVAGLRCARCGLVAAAHPGQVLLSAEANQALSAIRGLRSLVRSLGTHRIQGVEASQPIFQVVLAGQDGEFPPLAPRRESATSAHRPPGRGRVRVTPADHLRSGRDDLRAYQPSAGREVEMMVIDPAWAGEARIRQPIRGGDPTHRPIAASPRAAAARSLA